ncbi:MAG: flagellar motor switch protein FliN [Helicobacter sp.]|nr:flagellar motor switch protein FliN [Helicobacter sp.]
MSEKIEPNITEYLKQMTNKYQNLLDVEVSFSANLGNTNLLLKDILNLKIGSVINLNKPAGESVDININERTIGKGEVIVYEKNLAIRLNEILDSNAIIYYLTKENS